MITITEKAFEEINGTTVAALTQLRKLSGLWTQVHGEETARRMMLILVVQLQFNVCKNIGNGSYEINLYDYMEYYEHMELNATGGTIQ